MLNPKPNVRTCSPLIILTQMQIKVLTDYSKGQPKVVWEETIWPPIKNNKKWSNSLPLEKTQNSLASKFLLPLHRKCNFQTILNLYNIPRLPAILPWYPGLILCNYAEHVLRIQCSVITEIFDLFLEKTSQHRLHLFKHVLPFIDWWNLLCFKNQVEAKEMAQGIKHLLPENMKTRVRVPSTHTNGAEGPGLPN